MCLLAAASPASQPMIALLRARYREAAALFAEGLPSTTVAERMSWSPAFTERLAADDPAFRDLIARLRSLRDLS